MTPKRVVVTGIGTINPLGYNVAEFFSNLDKGVSGATLIDRFDASLFKTRFACQIPDYNPDKFQDALDKKESRKTDFFTHFAMIAADEAMKDSGLDLETIDLKRAGVVVGSGVGGICTLENELMDFTGGQQPRFSPFLIPKFIINIASGQLAIKYGFRGPNFGVSSACATSAHAISTACTEIMLGRADVMLTGGSEAPIGVSAIGGFNSAHALSTNNEEYRTASRPFDKTRDGFVIGEGAAVLIVEEYQHAVNRGARIYAEIAGCGMTCDAYHITAPLPDGTGASDAMEQALRSAGLQPSDVDYINVHGTSTSLGDIAELNAIKSLFEDTAYKLNISSTKSMTGHLLGAAGAVEALACLHAIRDGVVPPTINFKVEDENIDYRLNLTLNEKQNRDVRVAMSNNFGFGGQNASLIFKSIR
ncbi:MAG: beta-ketoacyl-ACP synthase II [Bacteroidales bacterium]|nr:beta-ketoacyl-ACP synthase II [Candidatus Cacconaster caballi]